MSGFDFVLKVGVGVILEKVDENIENAFLHRVGLLAVPVRHGTTPCAREYNAPGLASTRPSSSRMSSIDATASALSSVRATSWSTLADSKPSASNRIL